MHKESALSVPSKFLVLECLVGFIKAVNIQMDTVDMCYLLSFCPCDIIFSGHFCFKCMTKKSKGTGDNPGGRRIGGGGVNPDVTLAAVGVNGGMTVGCACGTDGGNGDGGEGSACCGGGGGDVNPGDPYCSRC